MKVFTISLLTNIEQTTIYKNTKNLTASDYKLQIIRKWKRQVIYESYENYCTSISEEYGANNHLHNDRKFWPQVTTSD